MVLAVTALAILGWMGLGSISFANPAPNPAVSNTSVTASIAPTPTDTGVPISHAPVEQAALSVPSGASRNAAAEMAAKALAATQAAGLKTNVIYVPHASASPAQIAQAVARGAAAPLYTGDPAPMGLADYGLTVGGALYVVNYGSNNVSVINDTTNAVVATIPVGTNPNCVMYDPANGYVYVPNVHSNNVSVISAGTNTVVATIPVGSGPNGAAYDSATGYVYVPNTFSNNVSVIDGATNTVVATISVGVNPQNAAYDAYTGDVYVPNFNSNNVSVISGTTNTVVATISVERGPIGVVWDSENAEVYVANALSNDVSVIADATNTVIASVPAGNGSATLVFDSGNGEVYVANGLSDTVSVIGGNNTLVATVTVGGTPYGLGYDSGNGEVYVANNGSSTVSAISDATNTVVATIPVGSNPAGVAYGTPLAPSILNTTSVQGSLDFTGAGVQGEDLYQNTPDAFSIQLNAVLTNVTIAGNIGYTYWAQDIVTYYPATGEMVLLTNLWNFSAPMAYMNASTILLHGEYGTNDYSALGYYYSEYAVPYPVNYPFDVTLSMTSTVESDSTLEDALYFSTDVTSGWNESQNVVMDDFDYVMFESEANPYCGCVGISDIPPPFTVDPVFNPVGLLDDVELVVAGPGGGSNVDLGTADVSLGLAYWNATIDDYSDIPSAFNYGSDTGETSIGANVVWMNNPDMSPNGFSYYGSMTTGPSILSGLWGTGAPPGGSTEALWYPSPGNTFLFVDYQGYPGHPFSSVPEHDWAPTQATTAYSLMPGIYTFIFELAGYQTWQGTWLLGEATTLSQAVDLSPAPGVPRVTTPLWAFNNAELAAISQSGSGTPNRPYVLFNNQTAPLSSDFGLYNDFSFPVFPGVFLQGTTASVELNNSSTFETYTNDFQASPSDILPPLNDLQLWFWGVSGVALANDTNISGWFGQENYAPLSYNSFNVIFYDSADVLVANNTFLTQSQGLLMYSSGLGGVYGGNNTVWGNRFIQIDPPNGTCPGPATCLPLLPYDSGLGLEVAEDNDLIFNNAFDTPTTAWLLPLNLYSGDVATYSNDSWNIAPQPASDVLRISGFPGFALTGSIIGGSTQGGNSWWDYGVADNWANGADNPVGILPYNENATTPLSSVSAFPCPDPYFCAAYIYPGGDYAPLNASAAAVSFGPHGLLLSGTAWGATISCNTGKNSGIGGTGKNSGIGGPPGTVCCGTGKNSGIGGTGKNSGIGGPPGCGGGDPRLVFANFTTTAGIFHLVLPAGAFNWTPNVPTGYTSTLGAAFVVIPSLPPVAVTVPFAPPSSGVVTFSESGLPSGLSWQVSVGSTVEVLTTDGGTDSLFFTEHDGTYSYSITDISGWHQTTLPYNGGSLTVNGLPVTEPTVVYFQEAYSLTFAESGLPSGLTWQVTVGGAPENLVTDGTTDLLVFAEPNGSYSYKITDNAGWHQSTLPYGGNIAVSEAGVSEPTLVYSPVTYSITFSEGGLPSGLTWSVTVNGVPEKLTTNGGTEDLTWTGLANGTYSYAVTDNSGWHQTTLGYRGNVGVSGGSVTEPTLTYTEVTYSVTFSESGLPSGLLWQVTVSGTVEQLTTNGATDTLTFASEPNGTWSYSISGNSGWQESTLPYSGTVSVNGGPVTEPTLVYTQVTSYSVTFSESGLPAGLTWKVTVNGVAMSLTTNGATDTLTFTGLASGTYAYTISGNPGWHETTLPYTGSVVVNGASITNPTLVYSQVTYSVTFWEAGLPSGLTWSLTVNGVTKSLTTNGGVDWLTWTGLANGTYAYSIAGNSGWHQSILPYVGKVAVRGGSVIELPAVYLRVTYSLTVSESGLPSGLTWKVTVNGVTKSVTTDGGTDSLTWTGLANGTYAYSLAGNPGWHQTTLPYSGTAKVNGAGVTEPTLVYIQVTYVVTFTESGLPTGTSWSVTLNGVTKSSTGTSILFAEPNGTLSYTVKTVSGYRSSPSAGSLTVNGTAGSVSVKFTKA